MKAIACIIAIIALAASCAWAGPAPLDGIGYQGKLADAEGKPVSDGSYELTFTLYHDPIEVKPVWGPAKIMVTTQGGIFSTVIQDSASPLDPNMFLEAPVWVEVSFRDQVMKPRQLLSSVPTAYRAQVADSVVDLPANSVASSSIIDGTIQTSDIATGAISTDRIKDSAVTGAKISSRQVVKGINGLKDDVTLAAGSNITITSNLNTLTISSVAAANSDTWSLSGNSSTMPGTQFLGTTDNKAFEIKVNNARVLHLEPTTSSPNVVGGWFENGASTGVMGATICGGGYYGDNNLVTDDYGIICGGKGNQAGNASGTTSDRNYAVVVGGYNNTASGGGSFVGAGSTNVASAMGSCIVGGTFNTASSEYSMVLGGYNNTAAGWYSFAGGKGAKAMHMGTFVWGDSGEGDVTSTASNQFIVRASGGTTFYSNIGTNNGVSLSPGSGSWANLSDRNSKTAFQPVDSQAILTRLMEMPVQTWSYKSQDPSIKHIGPTAQDFYQAFGVGEDDRHITTLDSDGVALAAIQGLCRELSDRDQRITELEKENADIQQRLAALEKRLQSLPQ